MNTRWGVIGAGAWGTALAILLAENGHKVDLWTHELDHCAAMQMDHENKRFLPGVPFPHNISVSNNITRTVSHSEALLIAVPSHVFAATLERIKPHFHADRQLLAWATKGMDSRGGGFLSDVVEHILHTDKGTLLTGPSFAADVAARHPTAVNLVSKDLEAAKAVQAQFHSKLFRTYLSDDLIGAQLGGSVKNILAIAVGIADGLGYGANTRAALMTRGLAEMMRLGAKMGAKMETLTGLAGLGDMVLTCTDNLSRNRRFGLALGQGKDAKTAVHEIGQVVEGIKTTELIFKLAEAQGVEMPITHAMHELLHKGCSAKEAVDQLLNRPAAGA
jgi:glycerol-3-phosphate dehydrogenase (NAD(P)+)